MHLTQDQCRVDVEAENTQTPATLAINGETHTLRDGLSITSSPDDAAVASASQVGK
ncbi:MAG: hypothetical protein R3C45_03860 [Phycisphaerales bacterium]